MKGVVASKGNRSTDVRYLPAYTVREVAHYTRCSQSTLRAWALGRRVQDESGRRYKPVIKVVDRGRPDKLSFINLVEIHALVALRKSHRVSMAKIRSAVGWLKRSTSSDHPLAELKIETDGFDLFIRKVGQLVNASAEGQVMLRKIFEGYLQRVDLAPDGLPAAFYPFTRADTTASCPRAVVIDPSVGFGRPVIRGTRIATGIIFERYTAGDSLAAIADDYQLELESVEEALRCEIEKAAA